jgi:Subtilase family
MSNQFIFRLTPINKKEFIKETEIGSKQKPSSKQGPNSKEKTELSKKVISLQQFSLINQCKCQPYLRLYEGNLESSGDGRYYVEEDGSYYEVDIQPNAITSNPDTADQPPNPPGRNEKGRAAERDNYRILDKLELEGAKNNSFNHDYPVVAILDSGIDLRYFPLDLKRPLFPLHYYENPCCLSISNCGCNGHDNYVFGYSFINEYHYRKHPYNPFDDDKSHKHGTRIAKIIADMTRNKVRLMILKTANFAGNHRFFDIYCAFEYILAYNRVAEPKDKVRIVNTSWGYKGNKQPIFTNYVKQLYDNNISLVTSAGNDEIEIGAGNPYYPAMYRVDNVHAITTVAKVKDEYEIKENYSAEFVKE